MTDHEKRTVYTYSTLDEKVYVYDLFEEAIQEFAGAFTTEIFFVLSDQEAEEFLATSETPPDNLKNDFIYYQPRTTGRCIMKCTCNNFLESDDPTDAGITRLAKKAVKHARRSGHDLNPRGN